MRYKSFRIRNFKGIKDTTVNLSSVGGAGVFAFVGLNESGKTTVLEAIHSFSPDEATSELLGGGGGIGVPFRARVPRHLISTFTGNVSVTATLEATPQDLKDIATSIKANHGIELHPDSLPAEIILEKYQVFKDGDYKSNYFAIRHDLKVRTGKQKNWRDPSIEERVAIRDRVYAYTPDIAYFPTFVFDFPERIFLTERGSKIDKFYRTVFQDILDYDGQNHTIEKDIVRRIRTKELIVPWVSFWTGWSKNDDQAKIQHVMDRAGSAVTKLIFGRWNKIFGEDARGKDIEISYQLVQGEIENEDGSKVATNEHDVFAQFQIKDGTRRFRVNDRSLGFRWFFAFMLFTQFRVARSDIRALLFLFDEPASTLHAAAQQKLIDSFPEIATGEHTLAYTTHSHYMIEPKWLEQTFIVTNRADAPSESVMDAVSLDDESLDIQVSTYRSFVNAHPTQTSYFQPVLDRLKVVPSKFDIQRSSVILEGKSDYYVLRYALALHKKKSLPLLPGLGAGTFGALAALHVGWNLTFLFVLDGDSQGEKEKERYIQEFGIPTGRIVTIKELMPEVKIIEDLLDEVALTAIQKALSLAGKPSKSQIRRFFQERLASDKVESLSPYFKARSKAMLEVLEVRLK